MAKFTFVGGVHPHDGKELSKNKPIKEFWPTGEMVYPLSQHIGAPAKAIVAKGDQVLRGQKIAEAGGFVSAPIYASASGTVKAIEPRRVATGDMVMSIVLDNDGKFEAVETEEVTRNVDELTREEIIDAIKEAGVVGMGGAGFPTHVKLSPKDPNKIDYVIANCAECEPYLTSDYRRMLEAPEELIGGLKVQLKLFPNATAIIGIEDNKMDCVELMKKLTANEPRILVKTLRTKYPQGGERQLIYATTKRRLNSKMLPADVGCVVNNMDSMTAIYQAVVHNKPLIERIVTVTGDAIKEPQNFRVPIGTNYEELIEAAGGFIEDPEKVISGGPMMGFSLFELKIPTTKTSSSILCFEKDEVSKLEPSACINCGRCSEACPSRIMPGILADLADHHKEEEFVKKDGLECIECGCCSFVCPAKKPLTQSIKSMRKIMLAKRKK